MASKGSQLVEERNKRVVPLSKEYESSTPNDINLAQDGSVDFRGKPVDKSTTGRVKANVFIIGMEIGERLAFYGISANLVTYLTRVLHEGTAPSARNVNNWIGATFIAPLLGAFLADAFWGRFWTILIFGSVYFVGLIMLTLSVTLDFFKPPSCSPTSTSFCPPATATQVGFFYFSLYLMSFGSGSMKPCIAAFGADQFDEEDTCENQTKKSFFNWWVFGISIGGVISATVMVYIQDSVSWGWGFGVPTVLLGLFLIVYIAGVPFYRHKAPMGSPITQIVQVMVAAARNWHVQIPPDSGLLYEVHDKESLMIGRRPIPHSNTFRFLDRAAVVGSEAAKSASQVGPKQSAWKLCCVTEVEEVKLVLRLLPIWAAAVLFATMPAQIATFYTRQGTTLDAHIGTFRIPAASLQSVNPITIVALMPLYDRVLVPALRRFTGNVRGVSMLQRIGIGLLISLLSMVAAAITEVKRVDVARQHGLLDHPEQTVPLSVFILLPQYILIGAAEVFTSVGALEFFYDQAPDSMRSLGTALFLTTIGVGNFLSSVLLSTIVHLTSRGGKSWIVDNLNRCRLDYFYWLLAGLCALNLCFFMGLAHWYKYKQTESVVELASHSTGNSKGFALSLSPGRGHLSS